MTFRLIVIFFGQGWENGYLVLELRSGLIFGRHCQPLTLPP
ncbi:hypothetical protein N44_02280 [Microcystis aeruginosa NIES-44]|uniref:Uncharacterized protein n=1 Tax=Microcystis aeruginosa NIES-44 TaxID=449439 RepID=A0A0A1VVS0_MICAE|nr:hypothetical protein N44_02280 [Microcystis aeruginosa NIES-44]